MNTGKTDLLDRMNAIGAAARSAARVLGGAAAERKRTALVAIAAAVRASAESIQSSNSIDVTAATERGLSPAMIDRLTLDLSRIEGIAKSVEAIADQADPVGEVLETWTQPNSLRFRKIAVPIGVIGMIYESRPNVTVDAAALCVRSGNAVILRGGTEAVRSNHALHAAIETGLIAGGLPRRSVQLLATQDRDAVGMMLGGLNGAIDLVVPRGGKGLVARVQQDARVPVLAHLDGINHSYVHQSADPAMAVDIVANAKMRRTGICGATETLLIDRTACANVLPQIVERLVSLGCELRGDPHSVSIDSRIRPASEADFATEHSAPILNVKVVADLDAALAHVAKYGSGHSDAIIARDQRAADRFLAKVDSAIVLHNASTQFADGGEFGFGAEIGIATGRLHARGPVGARHLTTFKYHVIGNGTLRP